METNISCEQGYYELSMSLGDKYENLISVRVLGNILSRELYSTYNFVRGKIYGKVFSCRVTILLYSFFIRQNQRMCTILIKELIRRRNILSLRSGYFNFLVS